MSLVTVGASGAQEGPADNQRCLDCHGQAHIVDMSPGDRRLMVKGDEGFGDEPATRPELLVDPMVYRGSVHADLSCVDCHREPGRVKSGLLGSRPSEYFERAQAMRRACASG